MMRIIKSTTYIHWNISLLLLGRLVKSTRSINLHIYTSLLLGRLVKSTRSVYLHIYAGLLLGGLVKSTRSIYLHIYLTLLLGRLVKSTRSVYLHINLVIHLRRLVHTGTNIKRNTYITFRVHIRTGKRESVNFEYSRVPIWGRLYITIIWGRRS